MPTFRGTLDRGGGPFVSHLRSLPNVALAAALVLAAACSGTAAPERSSTGSAGTTAASASTASDANLLYVQRVGGGRFETVDRNERLYDLRLLTVDDGDLGVRSVQVVITNNTLGNLVVQGPSPDPGSQWIGNGQTPNQGQEIGQHDNAIFGVATNDANGAVGGQLMLTGVGGYPVDVLFANNASGVPNAFVAGNDVVQATVTQMDTGAANHARYNVALVSPG